MRKIKMLRTLLAAGFRLILCFALTNVPAYAAEAPAFSIAWSEYPSWSVFGVATVIKVNGEPLVDGAPGKLGVIEKKWGVDIVLKEADYDSCITMYGAGQCDAACLTNMDSLNPALGRKSVAIMPTSTSFGADALLVTPAIQKLSDLHGKKVHMLAKSVSEYFFTRLLEANKENERDFKVTNMDPGAAATAMQQGQSGFDAIVVWNPFVLSTLDNRKDVRRLGDSEVIPGEITDMVTMGQDSLDKPGGKEAACAIADAYYTVCKYLADPKTQDDTLIALGEKFSKLNAKQMAVCCRQTRFYATPEQGIHLFTGGNVFPWDREPKSTSALFTNAGFKPGGKDITAKTHKEIMAVVMDFCLAKEIIPKKPTIGYGTRQAVPDARLRFDPSYMKEVMAGKK